MSRALDVLAVMDAACAVLVTDKTADPQFLLAQSRVAVADLIDAAHASLRATPGAAQVAANIRLMAALVSVGSAS